MQLANRFSPTTLGTLLLLVFGSCWLSLMNHPLQLPIELLWQSAGDPSSQLQKTILNDLLASRTLMALFCGAALGIAGTLIQQATRNSFASPATLGVNAGALLATVIGMILVPELMATAPILVAFIGAFLTTLLVLKLSRMIGDSPVNLVLVGMALTLALGAISAGLMMFWENNLEGLYTWGAGNLAQNSFNGVNRVWPVLIIMAGASLWFGRSLDLIELSADNAKYLGVNVSLVVNGALLVALVLSAMVVSEIGMISFIGLIAPPIARSLGFRNSRWRIPASALIGALLLLWADLIARWLSGTDYSLPAGAMTTLIGAPFMLAMLVNKNTSKGQLPSPASSGIAPLIKLPASRFIPFLLFGLLLLVALALFGIQSPEKSIPWIDLRLPRVAVAAFAGFILGISGLLLQTLLKNPLASPDVSGLTTSGVLFAVMGVVLIPNISSSGLMLMTLIGSGFALFLLMLIGRLTGFQPQLFALCGLCISALASTLINIVLVLGSNQSTEVLIWLSGSTYHSNYQGSWLLFIAAISLFLIAQLQSRKLDIFNLGKQWSSLLGVQQQTLIFSLLAAIAIACSLTVSVVGGISFIGLMAPHICRVLGLSSHKHLIVASGGVGSILLVCGDWASRTLTYPFELPAGLVVSCIGGFYFISLLLSGKFLKKK